VGRHTLNEAEQGFLGALLDDEHTKTAVDLDPGIAEALGVPSVSPSILDQLEEQASQGGSQEAAAPEPAAEGQEVPPEAAVDSGEAPGGEAVEVGEFQRADAEPEVEQAPEPELPSRATHGKLFTDKRAHPLQLLEVLTMRYKTEWTEWESDTLWWSLRRSFGPVGELVRNKIMALRLTATTDIPWIDWDVFEDCGLSWNDVVPVIGSFQPMTPMQLAFAIQIMRGIRPDDPFAHEVKAYIAAVLDEHGWVWAPEEWFDGAQEVLERNREHLVGLKNEVIQAWEQVQDADPTQIEWSEDDPRDIHVLKLFVVKRYLEEREAARQGVPGGPAASSTVSPPVP
jgi:hypothetical protein